MHASTCGCVDLFCLTGISPSDERKVEYAVNACHGVDQFARVLSLPNLAMGVGLSTCVVPFFFARAFGQAIEWVACRSAEEVIAQREAMITKIEEAGRHMHAQGTCKAWMMRADAKTKVLASEVNGPLLKALLEASGYVDADCADLFRDGWCFAVQHVG